VEKFGAVPKGSGSSGSSGSSEEGFSFRKLLAGLVGNK